MDLHFGSVHRMGTVASGMSTQSFAPVLKQEKAYVNEVRYKTAPDMM